MADDSRKFRQRAEKIPEYTEYYYKMRPKKKLRLFSRLNEYVYISNETHD